MGLAAVLPFMVLLAEPERITTEPWLRAAYRWGGFADERAFVLAAGALLLALLTLSRAFTVWMQYRKSVFLTEVDYGWSVRLLRHYLGQPYEATLGQHSGELRERIVREVGALCHGYLDAVLTLLVQGATLLFVAGLVIAVEPGVAAGALLLLGAAYLLIYRLRRRELRRLGERERDLNLERGRYLHEALAGGKTVRSHGAEETFITRFERASRLRGKLDPRKKFITNSPRYLFEVLAFGGIIGLTLYLTVRDGGVAAALPTLTLLAVAAYRLLPTLQAVFAAYVNLRTFGPSMDALYEPLRTGGPRATQPGGAGPREPGFGFSDHIELRGLGFRFAGAPRALFTDLNLTIRRGQTVAFTGPTGSGKTTLVDLITGLLTPTAGAILVDGRPLTSATLPAWRRQLAYVPQDTFLYDASLADNVRLGAPDRGPEALREALRQADLLDFAERELPAGLDTPLGEHGARLSGGQRQRVGLARALYRRPALLVLDEATSALDPATERRILDALARLPAELTVILVAHRPSAVADADRVYEMTATGQLRP